MATAFLHFVINESGNLWRKQPKWIDPTGCPTLKCIFWDGFCDNTIRLTDLQWWFLYSWGKIFWYSCPIFAKKFNEMVKFFVWKKKKFYIKKIFLKFFEKFQKNFWPEKNYNFFFKWKILPFYQFFLQRWGRNIKISSLSYIKIITAGL